MEENGFVQVEEERPRLIHNIGRCSPVYFDIVVKFVVALQLAFECGPVDGPLALAEEIGDIFGGEVIPE